MRLDYIWTVLLGTAIAWWYYGDPLVWLLGLVGGAGAWLVAETVLAILEKV